MKTGVLSLAALATTIPLTLARQASPVGKVLQLISGMQGKIAAEGQSAKKVYGEFADWCEDQARKLGFDLKMERGEARELDAVIAEQRATTTTLTAKVAELAKTVSGGQEELKQATAIREKEASEFSAETKELAEVIRLVRKAIQALKKEGKDSSSASLMQKATAGSVTQALSTLVQASVFSTSDAQRIASLDSDTDLGAPAGLAYEQKSSSVIETLEGILEKAEAQLNNVQQEENTALQNFEMLKQSLEADVEHAEKEMAEAKSRLAASAQAKATAEGELTETAKEIRADAKSREDLERECMSKSQDYEATTKSREEELKALAEAKTAIAEATGGVETSLLQLRKESRSPDSVQVPYAVVHRLRDLGQNQGSSALTQLASKLASVVSLSARQGADPFKKVRGMISDMLERLQNEAAEDATQEAFCDKELAETKTKKGEKDTESEELSTKIEQMSSKSSKLKEQIVALQRELADLAKSQSEMDALRKEEHSGFLDKKKELEEGLDGVKLALKVLRDYYGKAGKGHSSSGSSASLISMIEVCESDFSRSLSESTVSEDAAQSAYEEGSNDNQVDKASKEQAVKYKQKEAAELDKAVADATNDRSGVQAEIDAVAEYLKKLEDKCIGKPSTYEERRKARENELAGLKEALSILEGEEALVQGASRRMLRGIRPRTAA